MLVRKDTLKQWTGEPLTRMVDDAIIFFHDGRRQEVKVSPYPVAQRHPMNIEELWSDAELAEVGLVKAVPFVPPEGKVRAGPSRFERDGDLIREVYDVVDAPPPTVSITRAEYERLSALDRAKGIVQ